jgi:hypothetical protein
MRSGTGGKQIGPVLQKGQGTVVFIGGDHEKEALATGADVAIDQPETIDPRRGAVGEVARFMR